MTNKNLKEIVGNIAINSFMSKEIAHVQIANIREAKEISEIMFNILCLNCKSYAEQQGVSYNEMVSILERDILHIKRTEPTLDYLKDIKRLVKFHAKYSETLGLEGKLIISGSKMVYVSDTTKVLFTFQDMRSLEYYCNTEWVMVVSSKSSKLTIAQYSEYIRKLGVKLANKDLILIANAFKKRI